MTAQKRIIHTVTNDLNHDQRMQRICTSLTRAGFDCLLVGREKRGSKPLNEQVFEQKRLFCFFEKGPLFYAEFNLRLLFFLLKNRFDILNTIDLDTMPAGLFAALLKNKKRVFDAHEYFSEVPEVFNRKFIKKVWETIGDLLIPRYDACYTVGACLADIFTEKYGVKFETIRNVPFSIAREGTIAREGLRPETPRPQVSDLHIKSSSFTQVGDLPTERVGSETLTSGGIERVGSETLTSDGIERVGSETLTSGGKQFTIEKEGPKIIIYQGALNAGRGLEPAILAMKSIDFAELWLAGEGDLSKNLRQLVAENGLENRVKFLGFVSPNDLPELTKRAWLGLNLLELNGLSYYYSLANKFFDYIQNGVPSLNMAFPEYQKINDQHNVSLLLNDCKTEAIIEAVFLLKNDKLLYQKLVENSFEAAKIFNWENEENILIDLYKKLTDN